MISETAQKLKEILKNSTQEEFDLEWSKIENFGFQGPHADEVVEYFVSAQPTTVSYEVQVDDQNTLILSDNSFYTAA